MKQIVIVACGTGICTSTTAAVDIRKGLKEKGYDVEVSQCKIQELKSKIESLGKALKVIVATTPAPSDLKVPVISGVAFLTGIGKDSIIDQITTHLEK